MADFQTYLKKIFSQLSSFRIIFISTFIVLAAVFLFYGFLLERKGEQRMKEVYSLRNDHDQFEILYYDLKSSVNDAYLNSIKYLTEEKDIFLYRAVKDMGEINKMYNQFFVISRNVDPQLIPKTIQLKNSIFQYEKLLLTKLMEANPVENLEIHPIISDLDTLEQDMSSFMSEEEDFSVEFSEEEEDFSADSEPVLPDGLYLTEIEDLRKSIEAQLFELDALLIGKIDQAALQDIGRGVIRGYELLAFLALVLVILIFSFISIKKLLVQGINKVSGQLKVLASGELPDGMDTQSDEFDQVIENSNAIINYLDDSSKFALKIGDGDFNYEFHPKGEKDELGNALIQMRKKLLTVANDDKIRNWLNEGQAKFGDILRNTGEDFEELGNNIISNMVEYLNANQGGLYVKEESDNDHTKLELLSAYAFKRKKHISRTIEIGEGLIGQAFLEKKTIFLKEVKSDHFNIATGLGESKPSSVLIVPLKNEDEIEGVIEIASLEVFKDYQIGFVEKIGESIASSIKTGKINNTTKQLLNEMQTREEEMKAQEEELKQNMEELSATQEQLERLRKEDESRKQELIAKRNMLYEVLNHSGSQIYLKDEDGLFVYVNQLFAEFAGRSVEDIVGKKGEAVWDNKTSVRIGSLEKKVLEENISIEDSLEFDGKKKDISLRPLHIAHLNQPGVLVVIKAS